MDEEEIQAQACKFPRIGNGSSSATNPAADDEDQDPSCLALKRADNRFREWHYSCIIHVSRASGYKDRHNKVWTSKGLRDRSPSPIPMRDSPLDRRLTPSYIQPPHPHPKRMLVWV
ncbi:hypothetical protein PRUPE_3G099100 [Prunus persica]|uniref:Uncharacterized protein n=1 Tax=Prunus persica TaxID=3760 RepID=M5XAR0_PRUPE|nr:hypothetical protein PRUPE_3G099100 [Prunus persica]